MVWDLGEVFFFFFFLLYDSIREEGGQWRLRSARWCLGETIWVLGLSQGTHEGGFDGRIGFRWFWVLAEACEMDAVEKLKVMEDMGNHADDRADCAALIPN